MPGYIKSALTLAQARDTVTQRFPELDSSILREAEQPRFYSIKVTLLYASPSAGKKIGFMKSQKGNLQKTRYVEMERFHRFFVFGIKNTEEVLTIFTSTSVESHNLLRYHTAVRPGVQVKILNSTLEGLLKATNTSIISSIEPLIPVENEVCRQIALPHSVESAVFKYFEFTSNTVRILSTTATDNVCPGNLCDGQSVLENCGCLSVASKRVWTLTIAFVSDELQVIEDLEKGQLTSNATTDIFVKSSRNVA